MARISSDHTQVPGSVSHLRIRYFEDDVDGRLRVAFLVDFTATLNVSYQVRRKS